jgi:predicted pyridoxine 5'-phosphate oxidase superfamily flavin-nucleotide-binding protein
MSKFHAGELALQEKVGSQQVSERLADLYIQSLLPLAAKRFLERQTFAIASSNDGDGQVWASLLVGQAGFMRALDEKTIVLEGLFSEGDPLLDNFPSPSEEAVQLGLLVIELSTRRRIRLNGRAVKTNDGISLHIEEYYPNCPKYIQRRDVQFPVQRPGRTGLTTCCSPFLNAIQQEWIAAADTFFIATSWHEKGADASHRGGNPGFIQVVNEHQLLWPDYFGNNLFNTLGNLALNPQSGLLFVDFEGGHTLQLTGRAQVLWDPALTDQFSGAERVVSFEIDQVIDAYHPFTMASQFIDFSPHNP